MGWIDISVPVDDGIATFPGDPTYRRELHAAMAQGGICNVSRLDMGAHTGTHIDAPLHFIDGAAAIEATPLDAVIGPAWVVDPRDVTASITARDLERLAIPEAETRLLFRTRNSELWAQGGFSSAFIGLAADAADALVARGVRLVAIDYLSIAPFGDPIPTHRSLLGGGVVVLEGVDLRGVEPGPYDVFAPPVRIVGADGAPARALLRRR
jgi:arylformamidase